ncbi:MAG: hypothetical protein JWR52_1018 [Marmoricola sp.]|nr:hypothetical protein [Marmoricola sp.]
MDTTTRTGARWGKLTGSLGVAALGVGLLVVFPSLVGVSWSDIGTSLTAVPVIVLVGLFALWLTGLLLYMPVLMAAMPGLTARQALTLSLAGSSVSSLLPFGGPAGMGLGYAMTKSWGFRSDSFAAYTLTTNLWNVFGRFVMGITVLAVAAVFGAGLPSGLSSVMISASVLILFLVVAAFGVMRTERTALLAGRWAESLIARAAPTRKVPACSAWLVDSRAQLVATVRTGWGRMSIGVLVYLTLQAALLYACLAAVGAGASPNVVLIAFAIERLISLAPITPGAAGVAELGTVAALHSYGVDPLAAATGVLLYRTLMFAIEIPIGGAIALTWLGRARRTRLALAAEAEIQAALDAGGDLAVVAAADGVAA